MHPASQVFTMPSTYRCSWCGHTVVVVHCEPVSVHARCCSLLHSSAVPRHKAVTLQSHIMTWHVSNVAMSLSVHHRCCPGSCNICSSASAPQPALTPAQHSVQPWRSTLLRCQACMRYQKNVNPANTRIPGRSAEPRSGQCFVSSSITIGL
jgi:hypothetical protein